MTPAVSVFQAFLLPSFLPVLTSLLLAQQQHKHSWMSQAMIDEPAAIHMKANIFVPISAPMLSSVTEVAAFCTMTQTAVAMTVATVVKRAARKVKNMTAKAAQRE